MGTATRQDSTRASRSRSSRISSPLQRAGPSQARRYTKGHRHELMKIADTLDRQGEVILAGDVRYFAQRLPPALTDTERLAAKFAQHLASSRETLRSRQAPDVEARPSDNNVPAKKANPATWSGVCMPILLVIPHLVRTLAGGQPRYRLLRHGKHGKAERESGAPISLLGRQNLQCQQATARIRAAPTSGRHCKETGLAVFAPGDDQRQPARLLQAQPHGPRPRSLFNC